MCGIAGVHRLTDQSFLGLDDFCAALLAGIEERGTDATGYVAVDDAGGVQLQKASCRAFYFNQHRGQIAPFARTVLLHTRWATQGKAAFPENNHPVEAGGVYCVHNGHVFNDHALFTRSGKDRVGQVDSECLPALVASRGWDSVPECFEDVDGDFALALVSPRQPGELALVRGNASPLIYVQTEHLLIWASTASAISTAWRRVLGTPPRMGRFTYMAEGEALLVSAQNSLRTERFQPIKPALYVTTKTTKTILPEPYEYAAALKALPAASEWEDGWEDEDELGGYQRCEDCGNWLPVADLSQVESLGFTNLLCDPCKKWAMRFTETKTAVSL